MPMLGCNYGYGDWGNVAKIVRMEERDYEAQKEYVKKLWQDDPEKYFQWKEFCIQSGQLTDFFGTVDNPISIDESEL